MQTPKADVRIIQKLQNSKGGQQSVWWFCSPEAARGLKLVNVYYWQNITHVKIKKEINAVCLSVTDKAGDKTETLLIMLQTLVYEVIVYGIFLISLQRWFKVQFNPLLKMLFFCFEKTVFKMSFWRLKTFYCCFFLCLFLNCWNTYLEV